MQDKEKLMKFIGIWSEETAKKVEDNINEIRTEKKK